MSVWKKKNNAAAEAVMSATATKPAPSSARAASPPPGREQLHSSAGKAPSNDLMGTGRVKCVLSGDSIVLWISGESGGSPQEKQVTLSLLSAPRIARGKDAGQDQPFAWESREYLRHLLISQNVSFRIDFTHPTSGRQYGWIRTQDGTNVNLQVAAAGWAHVQEPRGGKGPRGKDHEDLLAAGAAAAAANAGIYTKDSAVSKRSVRTVTEHFDSRAFFEKVRSEQPLKGVVEGVLDGSTVRILLIPSFYSIVCRLGGVQCPLWKREEAAAKSADGSTRVAQPMAPQAKYITEYCLLNRDVMVTMMGVNKDDTYYGTVLYRGKNVADELLKQGLAKYVPWSAFEGDKARFRKTEALAKAQGTGMWKGETRRAPSSNPTDFFATVREVRTGSRISCQDDAGVIHDAFFSSVIAPKLNPRNPQEDEKLGFESKEFLRKKIVGKRVQLMFDYDKPAQPSKVEGDPDAPARYFYSVYLGKKHLPLSMVEQGLATVITHRREEARSREYSLLLEAEVRAKSEKKGLWAPNVETKRVNDMSNIKSSQAKQYLKFVQKKGMTGIVEFMLNPVRLKLFLPSLNSYISFTVAGVRAPWFNPSKGPKDNDFYGAEAIDFARSYLHQRRVEIEVFTCDKGGNFIGAVKFGKGDYATVLLEAGVASVSEQCDRYPLFESMKVAQSVAQQNRRGIWQHWKPESQVAAAVEDSRAQMAKLLVTHIVDASVFYCQHVSDQDRETLSSMMSVLQTTSAAQSSSLVQWQKGDLAAAKYEFDGMWYRVRLLEQEGQRLWRVLYVDFGNSEVVALSDLRPLDARAKTVPLQAKQCHLALLHVPKLDDEHGPAAAQLLKDLTWSKVLLANIEWKDKKTGAYYVTLGDANSKVNINKVLVRQGLALVKTDKARENKRYEVPVKQLVVEQEGARSDRLNFFKYGDIDVEDIIAEVDQ